MANGFHDLLAWLLGWKSERSPESVAVGYFELIGAENDYQVITGASDAHQVLEGTEEDYIVIR